MTDHDEHHHDDASPDGDADRIDPALSSAELAALTDLLRNEPVEIDELARERRIRVALAAMDEEEDPIGFPATAAGTAPAPVPPPRRTGNGRVWLVAAAVAAVVGLGGLLASTLPDGSSDRAEQAGVALEAADAATTTAAASPELGEAPAADGGSAPVLREESTGGGGPTSDTAAVTDLGAFASEEALRERVTRFAAPGATPESAPPPTADDGRSPTTTAVPEVASSAAPSDCVLRRRAEGAAVLGVATVDGSPVVVIVDGDRIELVDDATCEPR